MIRFSADQLITAIALPTITILSLWTVVIFHKNRKNWGPHDIPIVCILILAIIRNASAFAYLLINQLSDPGVFNLEYCSVVVWIFNSIHAFQASSLTTITIIGLFSIKLHKKQQNLRLFLTPTHIVYHLFCLTTLCACVGVAAILAQTDRDRDVSAWRAPLEGAATAAFDCKFMPFDLDFKFQIFILALHVFLSAITFVGFLIICWNFYRIKSNKNDFDYMKKSNSDLSELSLNNNDDKNNYYDTYTIQQRGQNLYQNDYCVNNNINNNNNWNSDLSTTVSSTNSKRPCLDRSFENGKRTDDDRTGLETIHPVLIVCYLFYHLPIIVLSIYPDLIRPWPVPGIALWLGLVQDVLIPVGLGIVDSRFCKWVSSVYRCAGSSVEEKLPHVGLVGKFRTFGIASQPQSLEMPTTAERNPPIFQAVEHRFPITNGSLYTSIDGRLPVIHNYRRNRDNRRCAKLEKHQANVAFHTSLLSNRHDFIENPKKFPSCSNCETDLCPSHSNLHHLSTSYINKQLNQLNRFNPIDNQKFKSARTDQFGQNQLNLLQFNLPTDHNQSNRCERISQSEESLQTPENAQLFSPANNRSLARLNRTRLSRSQDSLIDLNVKEIANILRLNSSNRQKSVKMEDVTKREIYSSDDDYATDVNDNFDSMSSRSCYSITTEANCDFDFFQSGQNENNNKREEKEYFIINNVNNRPVITSYKRGMEKENPDFRIKRSNSKRSLEDFQAYIEVEENRKNNNTFTLQRSNSYMTLEDRRKIRCNDRFSRNSYKETDKSQFQVVRQKVRSEEYLPNTTTVYIEDSSGCFDKTCDDEKCIKRCIHSIPDFKKVFISEYI